MAFGRGRGRLVSSVVTFFYFLFFRFRRRRRWAKQSGQNGKRRLPQGSPSNHYATIPFTRVHSREKKEICMAKNDNTPKEEILFAESIYGAKTKQPLVRLS